jgi:hypothetical protein
VLPGEPFLGSGRACPPPTSRRDSAAQYGAMLRRRLYRLPNTAQFGPCPPRHLAHLRVLEHVWWQVL